jgi:aminopeptidase N
MNDCDQFLRNDSRTPNRKKELPMNRREFCSALSATAVSLIRANDVVEESGFDVIHYDAQIEPDIARKTITGAVLIRLRANTNNLASITLDCGELAPDVVSEKGTTLKYTQQAQKLTVWLSAPAKARETREIEIAYHGSPPRGIRFFPDLDQVYTVFSTSQWMVCIDAPEDRATFRLRLILPANLTAVANGRLINQRNLPNQKTAYEWRQDSPIPTYIFGFAAGRFRTLSEKTGKVELRYLAAQFSDEEVRRIFRDTPDMLRFFEGVAGVPYADETYTQALAAGGIEQEMSSFTAMNEKYGRRVLADERENWLGAHEFAHQWWGNMVTNRNWNHFWLNEGMATFLASAYREHRFGRELYLRDIEEYRSTYERIRQAGKDRSLVFPDWNRPTPEDRQLVYRKGAYVLHLLREEMGEQFFWSGIRQYTRKYFGKSVETADFQKAMEQASGKNLGEFFARWVYLTQR